MKFKDLKLSTKQMIGFGFILLIMAAVNIFSIRKMAVLKDQIDEVSNNWLPRAIAISDINLNTSYLRIKQLQHAFAQDDSTKQEQADAMTVLIDKINENLDTYEALKTESEARHLYSDEERELFASFEQKWEEYQDLSFTLFALSRENETTKAIDLLNGRAQDVFNNFGNTLDKLVEVNKKDSFDAAQRAESTFSSSRKIITFLLIGTIIFSVFLSGGMVRLITIPVRQLEKAAKSVAEGDLDINLRAYSNDEIGNLTRSFNRMALSLKEANTKMQLQAEELKKQAEMLQQTNSELEEKSQILEKQKKEIIEKNLDLYTAMEELKATQDQLIMKEKMAALGSLVAGVAHEINNPIGTVNSSSDVSDRCINKIEIVLEQSRSIDDIKNNDQLPKALKILRENIRVTMTAGDRIATLVKSLRNFAGLDESEYQVINVHAGIDNSITLLGSEFIQNIHLIKEYGEIPKIGCYPAQLNQAFLNILKNARQAISGAGTIHIKSFVEDAPVEKGHQIHIQFSDTGKGIPSEKLKQIFNFGFAADEKRVRMGSGLSTAYNIVQKHGGEIRVQSEVGKGTVVSIILPIK